MLTAITLALGTKANKERTKTGHKGFIREGANFAKIEVSIRNVGPDALEPEAYGDVITVAGGGCREQAQALHRRCISSSSSSFSSSSSSSSSSSLLPLRRVLLSFLRLFLLTEGSSCSNLGRDASSSSSSVSSSSR